MSLIDQLIDAKVLKTEKIISAFRKVLREQFLPEQYRQFSDENAPVPIGSDQTNSQPLTVAIMLEMLAPKEGEMILDIGSGSGWTSALLAEIVGDEGKVAAVEIIPELYEIGRKNIERSGYANRIDCLAGSWEQHVKGPGVYNAILVSAVAPTVPAELKVALKDGGRLVIPIEEGASGDHVLIKLTRNGSNFSREELPGFQFVDLV